MHFGRSVSAIQSFPLGSSHRYEMDAHQRMADSWSIEDERRDGEGKGGKRERKEAGEREKGGRRGREREEMKGGEEGWKGKKGVKRKKVERMGKMKIDENISQALHSFPSDRKQPGNTTSVQGARYIGLFQSTLCPLGPLMCPKTNNVPFGSASKRTIIFLTAT